MLIFPLVLSIYILSPYISLFIFVLTFLYYFVICRSSLNNVSLNCFLNLCLLMRILKTLVFNTTVIFTFTVTNYGLLQKKEPQNS